MGKRTEAGKRPKAGRHKRIVILGLPPVEAIDVIGPAEVFSFANRLVDEPAPYTIELVCCGEDVYLESEVGIGLRGHLSLIHI